MCVSLPSKYQMEIAKGTICGFFVTTICIILIPLSLIFVFLCDFIFNKLSSHNY